MDSKNWEEEIALEGKCKNHWRRTAWPCVTDPVYVYPPTGSMALDWEGR